MRNILDTSFRKTQATHFIFFNIFRETCPLLDNVEKHSRTRQATNKNIARNMCFACWVIKARDTHSYYEYLLLFHDNSCHIKAPKCDFYTYIAYLV